MSAWEGAGSAGPGFPVLRVLVAPVGPQRRGALGLGQSRSQGGQVGGGAREGAAPAGLGGALKPEPRAASPACTWRPANPAWPHQQPVAGAAPEVLLPSDGAVVLTWGEGTEDVEAAPSAARDPNRPRGVGPPCARWPQAGPAQLLPTEHVRPG